MKYSTKYPGVWRGMHAPDDERLYRIQEQRPCAKCGAMTDWTDLSLERSVCSEECHYELATGRTRRDSR